MRYIRHSLKVTIIVLAAVLAIGPAMADWTAVT